MLLITLKPKINKLLDFKKKKCEDLGQQMLNMTDTELFDYEEYEKQDESNQNN